MEQKGHFFLTPPWRDHLLRSDGRDVAFTRLYDLLDYAPWTEAAAGLSQSFRAALGMAK